ncbi:hypothetical protein K450DRAFT_217870 [Umbelopsis ramanniana AG]|uniref:Enkurin domain-containing protein n=1 Tax=Umbelopsis ramanniana AG TaxID=1314678 RepID=A0AAD5EKP3_UMBRA|nr:uncharacterized protein K450DRAFT_217870 [Umbelopsis ramanniana AG]KAI8584756.1 hypothetical protein K450DRAFT_217870 [Umbelopsis ramanniana AG]
MQDMDMLLEKVKSANASARDAEREKETMRRELEQYQTVSSPNKRTSMASKRDSIYTYGDDGDDLDDQMRMLVKQKERLQSDYSKIPIIGGGPQSRKRKEDLEEQLDSIDSQLSKIKLKIRNRV